MVLFLSTWVGARVIIKQHPFDKLMFKNTNPNHCKAEQHLLIRERIPLVVPEELHKEASNIEYFNSSLSL